MNILQIYTESSLRNFSYLLFFEKERLALCIDPFYPEQILKILQVENFALKAIINTHEHWDHCCGNEELQKKTNCEIWTHSNAKGKIEGVTHFLGPGDLIQIEEESELLVLDTPGHTFAHLCLLHKEKGEAKALFTGDTLFNAGVGKCTSGGDSEVLYETITKQLKELGDEIEVYPGHEYWQKNLAFTKTIEGETDSIKKVLKEYDSKVSVGKFPISTLGLEKEVNSFLRLNEKAVQGATGRKDEKEVFLELRRRRDSF